MKSTLCLLLSLTLSIVCFAQLKPFEFEIRGNVLGKDSSTIYLNESLKAVPGEEIAIPIKNGTFSFKGISSTIHASILVLGEMPNAYIFATEPGVIEVSLDANNFMKSSITIKGKRSIELSEKTNSLKRIYEAGNMQTLTDSIKKLILADKNNFGSILLMNSMGRNMPLFNNSELEEFLNNISDPLLRQSTEYKEINSFFKNKNENINGIGQKALNFKLKNQFGKTIEFGQLSPNKMVLVLKSGSICPNATKTDKSFIDVYNKYGNKGFEMISMVSPLNYESWKKWIEKEKFPWYTLVEMDNENKNPYFYTTLLFMKDNPQSQMPDNYLVDEQNTVIAKNISADSLQLILLKKYDPEQYTKYQTEKQAKRNSLNILDRNNPINTFADLTNKFSGKPFFIDCWATWCLPCLKEFKYKTELEEFLKSQDIELVYINFDEKENEAQWQSFIGKYGLNGSHFQANKSFVQHFVELGYSNILPTYMIVDEQGNIVEKAAYRPSEKDKLFEQIKNKLKK